MTIPKRHPLQDRCTDDFRQALHDARDIARGDGSLTVEPEHLLRALALRNGCIAARCLPVPGFSLVDLLDPAPVPDGVVPEPPAGPDPGYSHATNSVLMRTMLEAAGLHHPFIGTGHLLLALAGEDDRCARALEIHGVSLKDLRLAVGKHPTTVVDGPDDA